MTNVGVATIPRRHSMEFHTLINSGRTEGHWTQTKHYRCQMTHGRQWTRPEVWHKLPTGALINLVKLMPEEHNCFIITSYNVQKLR